jgi:two-component system sensor histidine kinase UhpB
MTLDKEFPTRKPLDTASPTARLANIPGETAMQNKSTQSLHDLIAQIEAERLALGLEIFNGPLQELFALDYQINALSGSLPNQEAIAQLESVAENLKSVISQLRSMSARLRPPALVPFGLQKAMLSYIQDLQQAHPGLEIAHDLTADGDSLPEHFRLDLFRIFQQAMSSLIQYTGARRLQVALRFDPLQAELIITNHNHGLAGPAARGEMAAGSGLGLASAAQRAQSMGGRLEVNASLEQGFELRLTAPLPE